MPGLHSMLPEYGMSPRSAFRSTVLPAPFGPITARTSPFSTSKLTLSRTLAPPISIVRFLTSSIFITVKYPILQNFVSRHLSAGKSVDGCAGEPGRPLNPPGVFPGLLEGDEFFKHGKLYP